MLLIWIILRITFFIFFVLVVNGERYVVDMDYDEYEPKRLLMNKKRNYFANEKEYEEDKIFKGVLSSKKRESETFELINNVEEYPYDYQSFKDEYYSVSSIGIFSSVLTKKPEIKQAVDEIINVKLPENCTKEESENYGLRAMECVFEDYKKDGFSKRTKKNIQRIFIFWAIVYIIVAIPLWLVRGWCCCCCFCKFCDPQKVAQDAKTYIIQNPPGVYIRSDGELEKYEATDYEVDAFRDIEVKTITF